MNTTLTPHRDFFDPATAKVADRLYTGAVTYAPGYDSGVRAAFDSSPEDALYKAYATAAHLTDSYTEEELEDGYNIHADAEQYVADRQ